MTGGENDSGELRQDISGDGDENVVTFEQLLERVEVTDEKIQQQEFGDSGESSDEEEEEEEDGENNSNESSDENLQIEEDDDDEDDDSEAEAETEKPKLDEGFYEVESVRSKRVRKGQVQYLIKWRGWPETANTWEPVKNLMACSDVIDSFEESLHSVKLQSGCGHKRKSVATQTQINKKQQQQQHSPAAATYNVPAVKVGIIEEHIPSPQDGSNGKNHVDSNGSSLNNIKGYGPVNGNDLKVDSSLEEVKEHYELDVKLSELKEEQNELDLKLSELKGSLVTNGTSVDISRDGLTNGFAKANGAESLQSGRCVGAKKRKSGSVRRFKRETSGVSNDAQDASGPLDIFVQEQIYNPEFVDLGCRNKCGDSQSAYTITQIVRPLSYFKDVHGVSMNFLAKRSDGATVVVDNKFLKAHNPLPLISFYEQHLRYES